MQKTLTRLSLVLGITCALQSQSQTITETFETFTLSTGSYYQNTNGDDWQDAQATFRYDYSSGYWSGGSAYTNMADSTNGDFTHLYNCRAKTGYNGSSVYVTAQQDAIIKLNNPYMAVKGFYVTNTTYAYKSMKNGDAFAKKFGGTSGNDPDWFKLTVRAFRGGVMQPDSAEFYLADYRFSNNSQDYIVQNWQWVSCDSLDSADSLIFHLSSSDNGSFGMNTPAFFSIDDLTFQSTVGVEEYSAFADYNMFPNPAVDLLNVRFTSKESAQALVSIHNMVGTEIRHEAISLNPGLNTLQLSVEDLAPGIYILELASDKYAQKVKFTKQ